MTVVGAHLSGMPLNWQLTQRDARLVRTCRTHPDYRFYALKGTVPPKPGLVWEPGFEGKGIEVEVRTRCRVTDAVNGPDGITLSVAPKRGNAFKARFDHVVMATGHQWPTEPEVRSATGLPTQ